MAEQAPIFTAEFELTAADVAWFIEFHRERARHPADSTTDPIMRDMVYEGSVGALASVDGLSNETVVEGMRFIYLAGVEYEAAGRSTAELFADLLHKGESALAANTHDGPDRPHLMDYYHLFGRTEWGKLFMRRVVMKAFADKASEGS